MGSASNSGQQTNSNNIPNSQFHPTVCLTDWWLVKTEDDFQGRRLAVAGHTSRENQAIRVFSSAPILKRYDTFTIETIDGVCVIFKGFINKDHTTENGFTTDVFKHFLFGFPPHWKEYVEQFMGKESSSKDDSVVDILKMQPPQSETMESEKPHVDNCEKDLEPQDKMDVKRGRKSKKIKSSAVSLTRKSDCVISGSQENLSLSCIASGFLEKESYSGGPTVEDHTTLDMAVNCQRNKMKSVSDSIVAGSINILAVTDKVADDSQIHDSGRVLTACNLRSRSRSKKAIDNTRKVELDKINSMQTNSDMDMSLSEEILSHSEGRVGRRSISISKMTQKNNQTSARISGCEKIRSNCVSSMGSHIVEFSVAECEAGGRNNCNFEFSELHGPTDKIKPSKLVTCSVKDEFEQVSQTPNQDTDLRKVKTKHNIKKAKDKAIRSSSMLAAANNKKHNVIPEIYSSSQKAEALAVKTRRKLAYETPVKEKQEMSQSTSGKRSRSGRLLMPTLEFWRNEKAVYNADGTIIRIENETAEPRTGNQSKPQRKRSQPT